MRKAIFLIFFLAVCVTCSSQSKQGNFSIMLDLVGSTGLYSLNGEYEIGRYKDFRLNTHIGFGFYSGNNKGFIGIPFGINVLTGRKVHHLELGLGVSYIRGIENMYIPAGIFGDNQEWRQQSEGFYFVPSVGYRFDKLTDGLILKAYYSPLIAVYDFFDKEKFLNRLIPVFDGNWTKEEIYSYSIGSNNAYPTAKSKFGYFGISIGYRF